MLEGVSDENLRHCSGVDTGWGRAGGGQPRSSLCRVELMRVGARGTSRGERPTTTANDGSRCLDGMLLQWMRAGWQHRPRRPLITCVYCIGVAAAAACVVCVSVCLLQRQKPAGEERSLVQRNGVFLVDDGQCMQPYWEGEGEQRAIW